MTSVLKILTHVVWLEGFVKTRQDHFDAVVNLGSSETDTIVKVCQYVTGIYHINYGVIHGFLTFRKAVKAHVKKYRIFYVCLILPISCWHFTRISRQSVRLMKERRSLRHLADSDVQTFLEREESQNAERTTEKYVFRGFGDGIFLAAENENPQLEDLPQADSGRVSENFVYWKLCPWFVFVVFQRIFHVEP